MKTVQARAHIHQPTHVHSHIMQEVAATDSCLAFIGVHQHEREKPMSQRPSSTAEASAKYSNNNNNNNNKQQQQQILLKIGK